MARPSSTPRLRDVDTTAFGEEVARLVTDHAISLLMQVDPSATWSIPHGLLLQSEARMLAMYAQRGLIGDWAHHGNAADALVSVCAALYTCAARPHDVGGPEDIDVEPTDDIGVVILSAQARIRIDRRERVPVVELACLAGIETKGVYRQDSLTVTDGTVSARDAKRWLSSRGVEGI